MTLPTIGKAAPAFTLLNQDGEKIKLSDFKGKKIVVLYFYPKAMTPGCTVQACSIRDGKKKLAQLNVEVLGVSPDSVARLQKFIERDKLNFTLLSDEDNAIALKYGSFGPKKFMGKEYDGILRQTFIIDSNGKLVHVMNKVNTKTHFDDVVSFIEEHLLS
jgi:thioredoxin-dependent peroxiredoxin